MISCLQERINKTSDNSISKTTKFKDMDWKKSYAHEKLTLTIHSLATGAGDVRQRLASAFTIFHTLKKEDFPVELQSDWEWVHNELTKFGPIYNEKGEPIIGSVQNTCNKIKNSTGVKIAEKILEIYIYLDWH